MKLQKWKNDVFNFQIKTVDNEANVTVAIFDKVMMKKNIEGIINIVKIKIWISSLPWYCQAQVQVQVRWRSGEGQEGQIWTWAIQYFWFS